MLDDSIMIQPRDNLMNAQMSAAQALYHAVGALPAGNHAYVQDNSNITYGFTTTRPVPAEGQIFISKADEYIPLEVTTYEADRETAIETVTVTEVTRTPTLGVTNVRTRCRYGSNNYSESAIRQWLNSNAEVWEWEPKTGYDRPSSYGKASGFLHRLDQELVEVLGVSEVRVARNTVTDSGGQDILQDKVFLLSIREVGFTSEGTTTGEYILPWYEDATDEDRTKLLGSSPRIWWLRSPSTGNAISFRYVNTSGALGTSSARNALGLAPACRIK